MSCVLMLSDCLSVCLFVLLILNGRLFLTLFYPIPAEYWHIISLKIVLYILNKRVARALLSSSGEGGSPSKLMVLTISSWDSTKQWTASLPEGEVAEAIAVGGDWVAVATSKRMLRIFSAGGLQRGEL